MKQLAVVAFLCAVGAGCGSSSLDPEASPDEVRAASLREELEETRADLEAIADERKELSGQEASEEKINRLLELAQIEKDAWQKEKSLNADIEAVQRKLQESAPVAKPKTADETLADLDREIEQKERNETDRRRRLQEEELAAKQRMLADGERAQVAREQDLASQKEREEADRRRRLQEDELAAKRRMLADGERAQVAREQDLASQKEREEADRRRRLHEEELTAKRRRLADGERTNVTRNLDFASQKVEGGRMAKGSEGAQFEECWADVIQKVRAEIQRYKR